MNTQSNLATLCQSLDLPLSEAELQAAFLHSSYVNELPESGLTSNERLEFLGDAVVDLAVSEYLFDNVPHAEGRLTRIKAVVVSGPTLAARARQLQLQDCLYLGRGEEASGGRQRESILSDTFEALVGVVFTHRGYDEAARFVLDQLEADIEKALRGEHRRDYKTLLQEQAQRQGLRPVYSLVAAEGADHAKHFTVQVDLNGETAQGDGRRVKDAEQAAAKRLCQRLEIVATEV
ncbi:MAG: ribonuclease III [Candidatus Bipolaricaulia bacterium]